MLDPSSIDSPSDSQRCFFERTHKPRYYLWFVSHTLPQHRHSEQRCSSSLWVLLMACFTVSSSSSLRSLGHPTKAILSLFCAFKRSSAGFHECLEVPVLCVWSVIALQSQPCTSSRLSPHHIPPSALSSARRDSAFLIQQLLQSLSYAGPFPCHFP